MKKFFNWWLIVLLLGLGGIYVYFRIEQSFVDCSQTDLFGCDWSLLGFFLYGFIFVFFMVVTLSIVFLSNLLSKSNKAAQIATPSLKRFSLYRVILAFLLIVIIFGYIWFAVDIAR